MYNKAKKAKHKIKHNAKEVYLDPYFPKKENIHILYYNLEKVSTSK